MSTHTDPSTRSNRLDVHHSDTSETKPAFKTTELVAYILAVIAVAIGAAVDDANGNAFDGNRAFLYITILTVGYMASRGIAKSGSYQKDRDGRS
jgi:hypothetical protein